MDQSNNIIAAFNSLWTTARLSTGTGSIVPGGLQWSKGHMKVPTTRPYAQLWVKLEDKPLWTCGLSYGQNYKIEVKVWCGDNNTVLLAVDTALEALLPFSTKFEDTGFLTENSKTVHITEHPDGLSQEENRDNQQLVGIVGRAWRALLNQTRAVP